MKVIYTRSAEKEILKIDIKIAQMVAKKIVLLEADPYGLDSKKLKNDEGYRIRIGDYRVVYTIDKQNKIITIIRIRHRREVYRHEIDIER